MTDTANDELLDVSEACKALGVGTTKLYYLMRDSKISAVKIGKATRFKRSEINRFIAALEPYTPQNEGAGA